MKLSLRRRGKPVARLKDRIEGVADRDRGPEQARIGTGGGSSAVAIDR